MYLAIWFDSTKRKPSECLVMVTPLLQKLNAAVAVLKAQKRDDAEGCILSGNEQGLNRFALMVDQADDEWDSTNPERLLDAISIIAEKADCSIVPYDNKPAQVAAKVTTRPGVKVYPRLITPEGKKLWDELMVKYQKTIDRYSADKEKMWAAAILIYQRVAHAQGTKPFQKDAGAAHRSKVLTEQHKRINRGNAKALKAVEKAANMLQQAKLGGRLTNEKFWEAAQNGDRYFITTYQVQNSPNPAAALELLADKKWGQKYQHAVYRAVDMHTSILAEPMGKKKIYYYLATKMPTDVMEIMFPTLEGADPQTILRTLGKAGRQWVKTGTMKAVASVGLMTIHVNERRAKKIIEKVLKRLAVEYFYRTARELRSMGASRGAAPRFDVYDVPMTAEQVEKQILIEAQQAGLDSLAFEVVV
jgi:hypothetical protein